MPYSDSTENGTQIFEDFKVRRLRFKVKVILILNEMMLSHEMSRQVQLFPFCNDI